MSEMYHFWKNIKYNQIKILWTWKKYSFKINSLQTHSHSPRFQNLKMKIVLLMWCRSYLYHSSVAVLPDWAPPVVLRIWQFEEVVCSLDLLTPALSDVPLELRVGSGSRSLAVKLQLVKLPVAIVLPILIPVVPVVGHLVAALLSPLVVLVGQRPKDVHIGLVESVHVELVSGGTHLVVLKQREGCGFQTQEIKTSMQVGSFMLLDFFIDP